MSSSYWDNRRRKEEKEREEKMISDNQPARFVEDDIVAREDLKKMGKENDI